MSTKYTFVEDFERDVWYYVPSGRVWLFWVAHDRMVDDGDYALWDKHGFASMQCPHPENFSVENLEVLND